MKNNKLNFIKNKVNCNEIKCKFRLIISSISSSNLIPKIESLKKMFEKIEIYSGTGIPYISFYSEKIKNGETKFKANPPIRNKENRNLLLKAFQFDFIDFITSSHNSCPFNFKNSIEGDFSRAWNGFSSIKANLVALWTLLLKYENINIHEFNKRENYNKNLKYFSIFKKIIKVN